jgi:hypothetical protein
MIRRVSALVPVLLALAAGCGEKGPPAGAPTGTPSPVHGKVTFADGSALKGGIVNFYPVEREAGSKLRYDGASVIDAKGEYVAGFNGDKKGLVPGEYVVTVAPREVGELPGSNSAAIPRKFQEQKTTTLKITVAETENKIDIVLK